MGRRGWLWRGRLAPTADIKPGTESGHPESGHPVHSGAGDGRLCSLRGETPHRLRATATNRGRPPMEPAAPHSAAFVAQAGASALRIFPRRRAAMPIAPKPRIMRAQLEDSGTAEIETWSEPLLSV